MRSRLDYWRPLGRIQPRKATTPTVQIIASINDFHFLLMNEVPDDPAPRQDLGRVAACVLPNGIVDEIPGLAPLRFRGWGTIASTMGRIDPSSLTCFSTTSQAAWTAPQRWCPRTTTNGVLRCSAPYSIVPMTAVSTTFPALRATKSSPMPTPPKISSGDTRLSEQVRTVAHGDWSRAVLARASRSFSSHS